MLYTHVRVHLESQTVIFRGFLLTAETFVPEIIALLYAAPRAPLQHEDLLTELNVGSAPEMENLM